MKRDGGGKLDSLRLRFCDRLEMVIAMSLSSCVSLCLGLCLEMRLVCLAGVFVLYLQGTSKETDLCLALSHRYH